MEKKNQKFKGKKIWKSPCAAFALLLAAAMMLTGCTQSGNVSTAQTAGTTVAGGSSTSAIETKTEENSSGEKSDTTAEQSVTTTKETEEATQKKESSSEEVSQAEDLTYENFSAESVAEYSGEAYVTVNDNVPFWNYLNDDGEYSTESFESYSELDSLGRCGAAQACLGQDLMPTEERGSIGSVKPSGWHTVKYNGVVDGNYLYNRCHLIGYQLSGENANEKNLITGTRYLNIEGMLDFENMVADYIKETDNHVLYRVTPVFTGENLLADGVLMEGYSVEDDGEGIMFCVYCYNVQPGITIDYATGDSWLTDSTSDTTKSTTASAAKESTRNSSSAEAERKEFVLNTKTKKFHLASCSSASKIADSNRKEYVGERAELIEEGYKPCKICNP